MTGTTPVRDFGGHQPGSSAYRRLVAGLFFAGIATFAQLYSTQSLLPAIALDYSVDPATAALTVSMCTLGLAVAVVPWSIAADRYGRVPTMAVGVGVAVAVGLTVPLMPTIGGVLALRAIEGAALGAVPAVALAYLSEEVAPHASARAAGSYVAGTSIGGLTGRVVAGVIGDLGSWRAGVFVTALVCRAAAIAFLALVPKARGYAPTRTSGGSGLGVGARLARVASSRAEWAIAAQGFLLMGGFVALYNYLGFRLAAPPFELPVWIVSLLFLAYLAGTIASPRAGRAASRFGRLPVLMASTAVMAAGIALTLSTWLPLVLVGLVVLTSGFFAGHAVASGWAPVKAPAGTTAQASSLYYLAYYGGSSLCGWGLGFALARAGWPGVALTVIGMCALAAAIALAALRGPETASDAPVAPRKDAA